MIDVNTLPSRNWRGLKERMDLVCSSTCGPLRCVGLTCLRRDIVISLFCAI